MLLGRVIYMSMAVLLLGCSTRENEAGKNREMSGADGAAESASELKQNLKYAKNFSVTYFKNHKKISVSSPWKGSRETFDYYLVPRGGSHSPLPKNSRVFETPLSNMVTLSTIYLPLIDSLGYIDRVVGVGEADHINNSKIKNNLNSGKTREIRSGGEINYELLVAMKPDAVFSFAIGNPEYDSHTGLEKRGLPVVLTASYMEESPLGRAEWIKFMGHFLDQDSLATALFNRVDSSYTSLKSASAQISKRPTVFAGALFGGVWHVPGGQSFTAQLFQDAGAMYLWRENKSRGGVPLSFEAVYARAAEADFWLNPSHWKSLEEGASSDERYRLFRAFGGGKAWNHNKRLNPTGGNDYYETGSANPHLVLQDLIIIFHPELKLTDSLTFYRQLL